jgi:hypothetical protein
MVKAVRAGQSLRLVCRQFGVSRGTVAYWVHCTRGKGLSRAQFTNDKPGRAANRTPRTLERVILETRRELREHSALGEFGCDAILRALRRRLPKDRVPGRSTIYRVLERYGVLDAARRQRRPAPPKGWHLPDLARGEAELDTFDFIQDLRFEKDGPNFDVLTSTSAHGARAQTWILPHTSSRITSKALLKRWEHLGLPTYAQFDNDTVFQGAHQFTDSFGLVIRICLALKVIPVFAPPREHGFQNAIEGFNGLWQRKVWQRKAFTDIPSLRVASRRYIRAYRAKTAKRQERAPKRRPFPKNFKLDLSAPLKGKVILLRRSDDTGYVYLPGGNGFQPDKNWCNRLVRCEIDFTRQRIRFYALRRSDPERQPLLGEMPYPRPTKPFKGTF